MILPLMSTERAQLWRRRSNLLVKIAAINLRIAIEAKSLGLSPQDAIALAKKEMSS